MAAAASLRPVPIAREIFWGPMAYAMMGGIIVGTMQAVARSCFKEMAPATGNNHQAACKLQTDLPGNAPYRREMENA